jgi:predicted ATPase/class 3 adenylate cyclase
MHRVVPELIVENYRAGRYGGEFRAVGMFLDLSGFSKMTDVLMQHGQHGAEVLAGLMHGVFDPLVESIFEYGGRIISFAGDGIMALYPVEEDEHATALRALGAAWAIQQALAENPDRTTVYGRFSFSVKIGLAVGSVIWRILRSSDGSQATYYFRGTAVERSAEAEHHARAGDIILARDMDELLKDVVRTRPYESFHRFIRFRGGQPGTVPCILPQVDVESSSAFMPEDVIVHNIPGEFRQIVNLFMRIPDLPEEKLEGFIQAVFNLRRQYGGLLTRIDFGDKGCNLLMLWGAPIAYENDVSRALNFILDLQALMDFPITAGVTYYIAHAGYLGSEMCEDYTCYGWGVNLASRFMTTAPAGRVWVDERVARRVSQSFDFEYVGSQMFKGFAAAQKVNVLLDRKQEQDEEVIYQGEMVGRQAELERLITFVEPLWQGRFSGAIGVAGDAGVGKGRLVHELHASSVFREHPVLWLACPADQVVRQSFFPLRKWLRRYFGFTPGQDTDGRRRSFDSKLDGLLASLPDPELASELDRSRSILGSLVDLTWEDSLYSQLDAEGRYNNTFLALIALFKAESRRQPLVLFVDDVHYLDQDTNVFLSRLKRALSSEPDTNPVAVILAYRNQGVDLQMSDDLPDDEIELTGISIDDLSHLVEVLLGGPASSELVTLTMSRSEGNPYFAGQIIRYLQEEGLLEMSSGGWRQVRRGRASLLPGDIRALLVARLDQLTQEVKVVVQTASVLGREFEVRVLAHMLGPGTDTGRYVSEAEKAAIWFPLQEMRYLFHHALLRDAAYSMQMRARRRELHVLALDALETIHSGDLQSRYAELAYHAENGSLEGKAGQYLTLAGRVSADLFQNSQAVEYFTRALGYAPFDDLTAQFDLVAERVELHGRMSRHDLQLKDLNSLEHWADQLKDKDRLMKVRMLFASYHYFIGNYQQAVEFAKSSAAASEELTNSHLGLYAQVVRATALMRLGRMNDAMQFARSALDRVRALKNRDEECRILNVMGLIALEMKTSSIAGEYLAEALTIARQVRNLDVESKALNNLAMAEISLNGDYALARRYYEESYDLELKIGNMNGIITSLSNLGFIAGMQGDFASARSYYSRSLQMAREVGEQNQELYTLINMSSLDGVQYDGDSAVANARKASELAQKMSDRSGKAWAELYLGHAYLLRDEYEPALEAYQASLAIREELDQPSLSMESRAGLVAVHLARDDIASASEPAETILKFIENGKPLDGVEEPLRVYYTCYQYLGRKEDPRARQVLKVAKDLLEAQVSKFSDEVDRKRYVENIPWRLAVREAL